MPQYIMPGKDAPDFQTLDEFTQGYIEAALWTSEEQLAEEAQREGPSVSMRRTESGIESEYHPADISFSMFAPETVESMKADCRKFQVETYDLLESIYLSDIQYSPSQAGVDFWLTRNGHGAGFWDRGLGKIGDALSKACDFDSEFGPLSLYIGDDGKIYA